MLLFSTIGIFFFAEFLNLVNGQYNERCSSDRMRQCRNSVSSHMQKRINEMSRQDMSQHCGVVRDDFNCLIHQTRCLSSQSERQSNGDIIRKGAVYIRDGCDTSGGGWKDNSCFLNDGIKDCERNYPANSGQYSYNDAETCRKYDQFHECVQSVIRNRCSRTDDRYLGQYLVARTQELAYQCQVSDSDRYNRDRDSGYNRERDYDRTSDRTYDSYDRRDRDRDRDSFHRSQDDYGSDRYGDRSHDRYGGRDSYQSGDITCCRNERCSNSRMSDCRNSLSRTVDDRNGGYQDEKKCRKVRDDFNCLLWQTSCLPREERDRNNEIFRRARDFISRYCDNYGRWSENSCYKSSEMQRCESQLAMSRGGANFESCRAYNSFRSCMEDELRRRCTREDDLLQGAYLVEKAQEMSWQCGSDSASGSRQYGYDDRDRDRDRDDRRYDPYGRGGAGGGGRYDTYGSYEDNQPLDTDDEMCMSRVKSSAESCRTVMNEKRRLLHTEYDFPLKERKRCCSAIELRRCLYDATRRVCNQERSRVVNQLMERQKHEISSDACRGVYDRDCSGASALQISAMLLLALLCLHFW